MAGKSAILSIKILADAKNAQKGLNDTATSVGKFQGGIKKAAAPAALALAGIGAAALDMASAAAEDAQSQAILANSMRNATGASDAQIKATEDSISAMSAASGVADDQLRPAMATLVRATGDASKSQDALSAALDISAATGKDVESVSAALAKGYAGNTGALGKLVPGIDKAVLATGDMDKIMAELARTTGGASKAAAETAAGKMQRLKVSMDETKESIGAALLPILDKLSTVMLKVAGFAQEHSTLFVVVAGVIAAVAAAVLVLNVAMSVYTAVTTIAGIVSGAAWAAALGPILLVIVAIAAVIAIIVLIVKNWDKIRTVAVAVWAAVQKAFMSAVNWIKTNWLTLLAVLTGPLGVAVLLVVRNWQTIKNTAATVISWITGAWNTLMNGIKTAANSAKTVASAAFNAVKTTVSAVTSWISSTWGSMVSGISSAMSSLGSVLSAPFNAVESAVNAVVSAVQSLIGWLGRIHIPKISLPKIPGFNSAPAAGVGAGGFTASRLGARAGTTSTAGGITINVSGAIDPEATARQITRLLDAHARRMGQQGVLRPVGTL